MFVWMRPEGRWVHAPASSGQGLGVARFVRVRLVGLDAPCVSLDSFALVWFVRVRLGGSFRFVWFIQIQPGGGWDRLGSSCTFSCALRVAGFVLVPLVPLDALWRSLGSFGLFGSCGLAQEVFVFHLVRLVRAGAQRGVAGVGQVRLVCKGACFASLRSSMFVCFVRVRPECRWVSLGSYSSIWCALSVVGFLQVRLDRSGAPCWSLCSFPFVWYALVFRPVAT